MKKLTSLVLILFMLSTFICSAYAAGTVNGSDLERVMLLVEQTNQVIETLITKAVANADAAINEYAQAVADLEYKQEIIRQQTALDVLESLLLTCRNDKTKAETLVKVSSARAELESLQEKSRQRAMHIEVELEQLSFSPGDPDAIKKVSSGIDAVIMRVGSSFENSSEGTKQRLAQLNLLLKIKVEGIISDLIRVTNLLSFKMVQDAQRYGITVICEFVQVQIGGNTVLVDPLRITGY